MNREEFLKMFCDLIKAAIDHEGKVFGELLLATYMSMLYPDDIRKEAYEELLQVQNKYAARSRAAYDAAETELERDEDRRFDWPDEL